MRGDPDDIHTRLAARSANRCEMGAHGCGTDATDWHHRQRRREGDDTVVNALHLCRSCHAWAHAHPTGARTQGWIVSAWADPATVPVRIRGRWYLLTPDAGKAPAPHTEDTP